MDLRISFWGSSGVDPVAVASSLNDDLCGLLSAVVSEDRRKLTLDFTFRVLAIRQEGKTQRGVRLPLDRVELQVPKAHANCSHSPLAFRGRNRDTSAPALFSAHRLGGNP